MHRSMSDLSAIKASLKAAREAEDRLTVSIRHSAKIGALPPNLMSAQRELYEARRLLASAISLLGQVAIDDRPFELGALVAGLEL